MDLLKSLRFRYWLPPIWVLLLATYLPSVARVEQIEPQLMLGKALFFDPILSANQQQSCATCHDPAHAFIDVRPNQYGRAVSIGANGTAVGRRNTPTLTYVAQVPEFTQSIDGEFSGGLFHDGRASNLEDQASGPIFSPIEMALPSADVLLLRLKENQHYVALLLEAFEADVLSSPTQTLKAVSGSLAAFQSTKMFAPYSSKYDRFLRGEITLTSQEEHGRLLFFSNLVNCSSCHQLGQSRQTFTDYSYHNIGTPNNPNLPQPQQDRGLAENPKLTTALNSHSSPTSPPLVLRQAGKFRVPTLRNIAVTAPYMHNGVFSELHTVLAFYNKYLMRAEENPETRAPWRAPEFSETISHDLLAQGQPLDTYRIEALLAFLKTLTDARYEHLLQ